MSHYIANRPTFPRHTRSGVAAIDADIAAVPVFDVSESDQAVLLARFNIGTSVSVDLEAEIARDGTDRFLITSVVLNGDVTHNGHIVVPHGGLFVRPVVTALTGTDVDLILIPVFHGKTGI